MQEKWKLVHRTMVNATKLPQWAQQEHVIRAFEEIDADHESGMLSASHIWNVLAELRFTAQKFRCLEAYEPIENRALQGVSLERLLEYKLKAEKNGQTSPFMSRRRVWLDRVIKLTCQYLNIDEQSQAFERAMNDAARQVGLKPQRVAA